MWQWAKRTTSTRWTLRAVRPSRLPKVFCVRRSEWETNERWAWFIGENRIALKLTTKPEPYTLERTLRWVARQVAPTLKMLEKIDAGNDTEYLKNICDNAKLTEKHEMIIQQQTASVDELVEVEKEET